MTNHLTYKGNKYLLGLIENGNWWIANRRFLLTESPSNDNNSINLYGQFISSNWFNKFYSKNSDINLHIFCVSENILCKQLQQSLNDNEIIYKKSWSVYLNKDKINDQILIPPLSNNGYIAIIKKKIKKTIPKLRLELILIFFFIHIKLMKVASSYLLY